MTIVENGVGDGGFKAKVDKNNRLHTHAFNVDMDTAAALKGDAFDIDSGVINSSSSEQESGLLYIKNNETDDLIISLQFLNIGTPAGGSDEGRFKYYLNPTGGTLISDANAAQVENRRVGDAKALTADVYSPLSNAAGKTITGGKVIEFSTAGFAANSPFILPQGQTFAMSYVSPTGNTGVDFSAGIYLIKNATEHGND